jgi:hypothetical protein
MQRQFYDMNDTGTQAVTGANFSGNVEQYRWVNTGGDTGGTLEIGLYPRAGDTGDGFVFASHGLLPQLTKLPRQPMHGADGGQLDTGGDLSDVIVAAGDRLIAKKTGAAGTGRLYVWIKD